MLLAKSPEEARTSRPRMLVFGRAGIGKTWGSLSFPNAYYIDTEGGANLPHYTERLTAANALYMGPEDGANDLTVILQQIMALATLQHDRKTLIIDSLSKAWNTAIQIEHDRQVESGRPPSFGSEKKPAVALMRRIIRWIDRLDMTVILICHSRPNWVDGIQEGDTFDAWDKLAYELSLVVEIIHLGDEPKAKIIKTRYESFDPLSVVDWDVATFTDRFDTIDNATKIQQPSTKEQVAEIEIIIDEVGCEHQQKWWDHAGVESWKEMTFDQLNSCIKFLNGRVTV